MDAHLFKVSILTDWDGDIPILLKYYVLAESMAGIEEWIEEAYPDEGYSIYKAKWIQSMEESTQRKLIKPFSSDNPNK